MFASAAQGGHNYQEASSTSSCDQKDKHVQWLKQHRLRAIITRHCANHHQQFTCIMTDPAVPRLIANQQMDFFQTCITTSLNYREISTTLTSEECAWECTSNAYHVMHRQ